MSFSYEIEHIGEGNTVFVNFTMRREGDREENICGRIRKACPNADFSFVNVYAQNWNRDYSPWEFIDEESHKNFEGCASVMLDWVKNKLLPEVETALCKPNARCFIGGYSLAGLFALWAAYETDLFDGCVIGSASLWFPGVVEYIRDNELCKPQRIYMSLGAKEEKTRDRYMSRVGGATRTIYEMLQKDANVSACTLEINPGNHFNDPEGRMAKGYAWMLDTLMK